MCSLAIIANICAIDAYAEEMMSETHAIKSDIQEIVASFKEIPSVTKSIMRFIRAIDVEAAAIKVATSVITSEYIYNRNNTAAITLFSVFTKSGRQLGSKTEVV